MRLEFKFDGCRHLTVPGEVLACDSDCKRCPLFQLLERNALPRPWWHRFWYRFLYFLNGVFRHV